MGGLGALSLLTVTVLSLSCPDSAEPGGDSDGNVFGAGANEAGGERVAAEETVFYGYEVVAKYRHDRDAFTQGLVFEDGTLYEGTGLYGRSSLRRVALCSGNVIRIVHLDDVYFGEGITVYGNTLVQLTWRSHVGFIYDRNTFELLDEFSYATEGWGITHDGDRLIMSDGTSRLFFLDPATFVQTSSVQVLDEDGAPVPRLNELEYIGGKVYANVWQTNRIAIITPETGHVAGWIELEGLLAPEDRTETVDVLNGIAYDAAGDRLFVTGKFWPWIFEIVLVPSPW